MFKFLFIVSNFCVVVFAENTQEGTDLVDLVRLGDEQIERGNIRNALDYYEKAYESGAGSAQFLNRLSVLYMETEQFAKAIEILRTSLAEMPGQVELYSRIGEAQLALGQLDSAIVSIESALKLDPQNSSIHSALAFLLMQANLTEKAKDHLDNSVRLDSSNAEAHRLLGFYFAQLDSVDTAIKHYKVLASLVPDDFESFNNIAFLLANRKEYISALKYYEKAKDRIVDPYVLSAIIEKMEDVRALMDGKMRARYILVDSESLAKDIYKKLNNGEDFLDLAMKYSIASNSKDGGDLGFFGSGELLPEFEEAVIQLRVGDHSRVIQITQGYVVIQRLN